MEGLLGPFGIVIICIVMLFGSVIVVKKEGVDVQKNRVRVLVRVGVWV